MKVDYIVVGIGLAGIGFCEQLRANNKTFVVFDDQSQRSSIVAGGLYNPVVLKRFTPVWKSDEQLLLASSLYSNLEKRLKVKLDYKIPVYRKFTSFEEQNDWYTASDKPQLTKYLSTSLIRNNNNAVNAPYGFGEVKYTGRIAVKKMVKAYKHELNQEGRLIESEFKHSMLHVINSDVTYNHIKAKNIVFTEGYNMSKNPFFTDLPLLPTKGELLTIHAPDLEIDYVLKGPVFLIPLKHHNYLVGATYGWGDTSNTISESAKIELSDKLKTLINCPFEVVDQVAGVRPTVKDRRPLVGRHATHGNLYVFNGLGTRGVMIAPYVAKQLFEYIEFNTPLDKDIDIKRFDD
ncbi:FAD-binding oxidoreductase [Aestuariivivens sp. NBU2969]|uniref:NAD(P)/FAD-dependent oxidoreductase n=1 Tax=Aestuariivivens sp. NBU2969 TaxID=2873267 RepID=UPI001CBC8088|nr:FAD-dependent oxidoreductase [Aestuariivivens sp. NBU2969]